MSETKPLRTCSVSKDDVVVAMTHTNDTSLEHVIKMEEVDLKPEYIVSNYDGYLEKTQVDDLSDDLLVNNHNDDKSLTTSTDVHIKEEIMLQYEFEIPQDEDIKEFNKQHTEVKQEIDTNGILSLNEHGTPNNLNTEMKMEQKEQSDMDVSVEDNTYLTEVSNKRNNLKNKVAKGNKYKSKGKSFNKNKLNQKYKTYLCNDCIYKSRDRYNFIRHIRRHTGEKPYTCKYCEFSCTQKSNLAKHSKTHTGEKSFLCTYCDYKTTQKSHLTVHLRRHNGAKPFSCKFCLYKCSTSSNLKVHTRSHTGEKPYLCPSCPYKGASKTNLTSHLRIHTREKPFSCEFCEYKSAAKSSLKNHLTKHTAEKSNSIIVKELADKSKCVDDIPYKAISNKKNEFAQPKKKHSSKVNSDSKNKLNQKAKTYMCNDCAYKSTNRRHFVIHLRMHTVKKPFSCNFCEYKCVRKAQIENHLTKHTGVKPFCCYFCEYKCTRKSSLTLHLRAHTGAKPFSCQLCEYRCARKGHLTTHLKRHTGEKPFACELCDYSSVTKAELKRHSRIHTGEKS